MVFTVLFDIDNEEKEEIIKRIVANEPLDDSLEILRSYKRALNQLKTGKFYDFFKFRKPLKNYLEFKLKDTISHCKPFYTLKDGKYILVSTRKCPLCGAIVPEGEIEGHVKEELDKQNKVVVLLDSSIRKNNNRFEYDSCTVKELKKDLYDKLGISVSKLEVFREEAVLGNNEVLRNETVSVRQKRRSNK